MLRPVSRKDVADKIISLIRADVDLPLRETHGKNRSPRIDQFNIRTGAPLGSPYCASGIWAAIDDACEALGLKNPVPKTASSQAFRSLKIVPLRYIKPPGAMGLKGDLGVFQVPKDQWHGHLVALSDDQTDKGYPFFLTVEYNTDAISGDRDGDGAYAMTRSCISRTKENSGKIFVCFTDIPQWISDHNFGN